MKATSFVFDSPLVSGPKLWQSLGFRNANAFSQAARQGRTPIKVFSLRGRAGKFALKSDLEAWLAELRHCHGMTDDPPSSTAPAREHGRCPAYSDGKRGAL